MARLATCVQKATGKWKDEAGITHPKLDHLMKRGLVAEASNLVTAQNVSPKDAEVMVVKGAMERAKADAARVDAALKSKAKPAQAATPRRPVDRDASVNAAIEKMHATPQGAFAVAQAVRSRWEGARARTKAALAKLPDEKDVQQRAGHVRAFSELNAIVGALPSEVRGKIGGTVTLANLRSTDRAITDFLVERVEKMDKELENYFQQQYKEKLNVLLQRGAMKRASSGMLKSTIGADAQDVVNRVSGMMRTPIDQVVKEVQMLEDALARGLTPEEEAKAYHTQEEWNTFGDTSQMTATQLEAAYDSLADTVKRGKAAWGVQEEKRLADQRAKSAEIVQVLPPSSETGVNERNKWWGNAVLDYARNHTSFLQILERLFPGTSFVEEWQNKAIAGDNADQDYVRLMQDKAVEAIRVAANLRFTWQAGDLITEYRKSILPHPDGGKISKFEAMQFIFAWGQPKVQERMRNQGWTDKNIKVLADALSDSVSGAIMQHILAGYEEVYQKADPVVVEMSGAHLPRIEGTYAPMRYRTGGSSTDMTMTGGAPSSGITPTGLRQRVEHNNELKVADAFEVYFEHVQQMSHWIHFAPLIRETRGVLNSANTKQALEQSIGREGVGDFQKMLDTITRNGVARSMEVGGVNKLIDRMTRGAAVGWLAFNMHTGAAQLDSAIRWMHDIPMQRWGNVLLAHRWITKIPMAWRSATVQRRVVGGMNPLVQATMKANRLSPWKLVQAVNAGFWHINMIDGAATALSSAIVYADAISQKMTHEQALIRMDIAVSKYSQPTSSVSKAAGLLTASSAGTRAYLLFMADPTLKTTLANEGLMHIGRGNWEIGIRRIVAVEVASLVTQFVLNAYAHFLGDGAVPEGDDEDEWMFQHFWRAAIMAPLQGWFIAGNIAEALIKWAFREGVFRRGSPADMMSDNIISITRHFDDLASMDLTSEAFWKEVGLIGRVGAVASPVAGAITTGAARLGQGYLWIKEKTE